MCGAVGFGNGGFVCYSPEHFPPGGWGPASFGGNWGLARPGRKFEFARPADSTGVEAATLLLAQARTTMGSLGLPR
jgi:hypothetical protein